MTARTLRLALLLFVPALGLGVGTLATAAQDSATAEGEATEEEKALGLYYLEVVSSDVDATCSALEKLHGVRFGKPAAELGKARTATLKGGGRLGVRAPMHEAEQPVVRPYLLVDDIEAAVKAAEEAGAELAMTATEIPGQGEFAIYFLGGNQYGLWEH